MENLNYKNLCLLFICVEVDIKNARILKIYIMFPPLSSQPFLPHFITVIIKDPPHRHTCTLSDTHVALPVPNSPKPLPLTHHHACECVCESELVCVLRL